MNLSATSISPQEVPLVAFTSNERPSRPRFSLGQIVATPACLEVIEQSGQSPAEFLNRHARGDWGDVCDEDRQANDQSVVDGTRLLSAYHTNRGAKIWIITEAADETGSRSGTTLLLPDEY